MNYDVIAHVIQISVAPVFLLTGIGTMLSVLSTRLARAVDRARAIEQMLPTARGSMRARLERNLKGLSQRARIINTALSLCVASALLVCGVIVALFTNAFWNTVPAGWVPILFTAALVALILALLLFLREVHIATASLRFGVIDAEDEDAAPKR
jgi:uncharacterized membrane protein